MIISNNLFFKYLLISTLLPLCLFSLFLSDFMLIWFFMEIMNILFISLAQNQMKEKSTILLYFLIQITASFLMIFTITLNNYFVLLQNYSHSLFLSIALFMKLGIPPFHFWLPMFSIYAPWSVLLILLTLQKLPSFYMLSLLKSNHMLFYTAILLCSTVPPLVLMNNHLKKFKVIMAYSSINHSAWMLILLFLKNTLWFNYFLFYSIMTLSLFILINYYKMFINFNYLKDNNFLMNLIMIMIMLNMAGMPPFSFFFIKWYSIYSIALSFESFFLLIILTLNSLFMIYIYTYMMIYNAFFYMFKSKLLLYKSKMSFLTLLVMLMLISAQIMLFI